MPTLRHATGFLSQGAAPKVTARAAKRQRQEDPAAADLADARAAEFKALSEHLVDVAAGKPSTKTAFPFGKPVFEEWDGPEPFGALAAGWGHRSLCSYQASPKRSKK